MVRMGKAMVCDKKLRLWCRRCRDTLCDAVSSRGLLATQVPETALQQGSHSMPLGSAAEFCAHMFADSTSTVVHHLTLTPSTPTGYANESMILL